MLTKRGLVLLALFICLTSASAVVAQDEDASKAIKAEEFIKERPAATKKPMGRYRPAPKSTSNANGATPPPGTTFAQMGVTFWRLRKSTVADKTKELIEDEEGTEVNWTPERIEEDTPLYPGQKVRLGIESLSRAGYLYVIDRAQYADGTLGEPLLIFPTLKTNDLNRVKAGRLIYIPSATGKFTITPSDSTKNHVGELVTIIVAAQPLVPSDQLASKAIRLRRQQVESWEKQWGAIAARFDMDDGVGQAMTEKEQIVGSDKSQELTQDDPPPQTVYRLAIKPENPILLNVQLKFHR